MCDYNIVLKPDNTAILVCTDGLTNFVDEENIFKTVKNYEPEDAVNILINMANAAGGSDNITAVLIY